MVWLSVSFETMGETWDYEAVAFLFDPGKLSPTVKAILCLKGIKQHVLYTAQAENRRASKPSTGSPYPKSRSLPSQTLMPSLADLWKTITIMQLSFTHCTYPNPPIQLFSVASPQSRVPQHHPK